MSFQNISLNQESSNQDDDFIKDNQAYSIDTKNEDSQNKQQSLINIQINLGDGKIKELKIDSIDNIEESINDFCIENNLPIEAKKPIKNLLLKELNKKISECK